MFDDSQTTTVTFRLDAAAEQAYLCLRPCDGSPLGDRAAWITRPLRQVAPGRWESVERLPPGWWRFRYYTAERGMCFYAKPTQSALHMDGLDAMLHVSRVVPGAVGGGSGGRFLTQALAAALAPVVPGAWLASQQRPRRVAAETDVRKGIVAAEPEDIDQHILALAGVGDDSKPVRLGGPLAAPHWHFASLS